MAWMARFTESSHPGKAKGSKSWWNNGWNWNEPSNSSYWKKSKGEPKKMVWKPKKVQEMKETKPEKTGLTVGKLPGPVGAAPVEKNPVLLGASPCVELETQANLMEKIEMKSEPLSPSTTMAEDLAAAAVSEDDGPAEGGEAVQTVEKVVEIPQVGQTVQGTTQEVDMPLAPRCEDAPAQVVEQMIAGEEHPQVLPPQVVGTMAPTQMAPVTVPAVPEEGLAVKGAIHLSMQAVVAPVRKSCLQDSLALEWYEDLESDADGTESDFDLDLLEAEDDDKEDSATTEWFDHLSGAEWWNAYAPFHIEDYC